MRINAFHNRRGFSLFELTVVVVITSIISLVAVGSYAVMKQRRNLRGAAQSINSAFVTARSYAVSRNAWHRVTFQLKDPANGQEKPLYWIDEIQPNSSTTPNPAFPETAVRPKITTPQPLPVGVHFLDINVNGTTFTAASEQYIVVRFMPNGSSDQANVRIYEDSQAGNRPTPITTIRLYAATGKSKIVSDTEP
jgi:prepilin-type N-terminal cleavage/methylation domain-containing protein